MARLHINDKQWKRICPMIPAGKPGGRPPLDRRTILDGILWILRNGASWRDLPEESDTPQYSAQYSAVT